MEEEGSRARAGQEGRDGLDSDDEKQDAQKRTVQIFVKVNGSKVILMEVSLTDDKVEDVMKRIQKDEDAHVTTQGRVLRRNEKLESCGN